MNKYKFIFIAGLHRSGTTLLAKLLGKHPDISGFDKTSVPADEGQHLQNIFPPALNYGGPGKFGFSQAMHLTESSPLIKPKTAEILFDQWSKHWDLSKSNLLEKSPPNLLKTRFLQQLFPNSYFIVVTRHPVAVSLATIPLNSAQKHTLLSLINHWTHCHQIYQQDKTHLHRKHVIFYENLLSNPTTTLNKLYKFLGLVDHTPMVEMDSNRQDRYLQAWQAKKRNPFYRPYISYIEAKFKQPIWSHGYSFKQPELLNYDRDF